MLSLHERKIPDPEDDFRRIEESYLQSLGPSLAVQRLRRRWGKVRTRMHVFGGLKGYAEWLRTTGKMPEGGLDALVKENQLNQLATDVNTRIRHLEWAETVRHKKKESTLKWFIIGLVPILDLWFLWKAAEVIAAHEKVAWTNRNSPLKPRRDFSRSMEMLG